MIVQLALVMARRCVERQTQQGALSSVNISQFASEVHYDAELLGIQVTHKEKGRAIVNEVFGGIVLLDLAGVRADGPNGTVLKR